MAFHILGDQDTIVGFAFAGVSGTVVAGVEQARPAFAGLLGDDSIHVVVVTEPIAEMLDQEITAHRLTSQPPFVVEIADIWETPIARKSLEEMIQEAVGIRIVQE